VNDKYIRATVDKSVLVTEGMNLYINVDPDKALISDPETKKSINI